MNTVTVAVSTKKITNPKEIKTEGTQLFNVPNTPEGLEFVRLASKFLNRSEFDRMYKKGRGKNRPKTIGGDLKTKDASWFAVYASPSAASRSKEYARYKEHNAYMEKYVREKIGKEQLEKGIILPETIALLQKQIAQELSPSIRAKAIEDCKASILDALNSIRK